MNIRSVSKSLFLTEQIQKQVVSLNSSDVYLSVDIKYVGVITIVGIQCTCEALAQ